VSARARIVTSPAKRPHGLCAIEVFESQGWRFEPGVRPTGEFFQPVAICRSGTAEAVHLTEDAAPYATAAEALRHARQRAMRYATHR
jgi:hypothetical protein